MAIALTQSDFQDHMKNYLDEVEDYDETLYVTRSKDRSAVAVISQEKLKWLERAAKAPIGSLDQAVARDKLIELGVLPDDSQNVYADNEQEFWDQFKNSVRTSIN
ncbi:type II toxin-antitoxin system Phd/YefM family antitoxin [Lactobacillus sp. ESL0791]|uniref:type II toxin-antitoxin system Phd/YefM family antitoxin n=1 Tax=Lactobacillus sp. ESL0791 TaxID=2983234 RepID=UPI0023F8DF22|nr:type II toxin-antitoxin system Phd/YefM family antitoxin [Lactobacillus sp. ESL0791]MDF7638252.1 type II toxin-antitoxin system Phd/YefM family antitoxin [Lactobacillus sp. ESL0791]